MKDHEIFVHDCWDGMLASTLTTFQCEYRIRTAAPGYNKKTLYDYIAEQAPSVVMVSIPVLDWPVVTLYERYIARHAHIPIVFVTKEQISGFENMFWPPARHCLKRSELCATALTTMLSAEFSLYPTV